MKEEHPLIESKDVEQCLVIDWNIDLKTHPHRYGAIPSADKEDYNDEYNDIK